MERSQVRAGGWRPHKYIYVYNKKKYWNPRGSHFQKIIIIIFFRNQRGEKKSIIYCLKYIFFSPRWFPKKIILWIWLPLGFQYFSCYLKLQTKNFFSDLVIFRKDITCVYWMKFINLSAYLYSGISYIVLYWLKFAIFIKL